MPPRDIFAATMLSAALLARYAVFHVGRCLPRGHEVLTRFCSALRLYFDIFALRSAIVSLPLRGFSPRHVLSHKA